MELQSGSSKMKKWVSYLRTDPIENYLIYIGPNFDCGEKDT